MFCKWIHDILTGSIHVNSPDSVNTFDVLTYVYREITSFSRDDTCQWNRSTVPVQTQNTCIHMKTCIGEALPIMNQYDKCQLVQKWFLVCWDDISYFNLSNKILRKSSQLSLELMNRLWYLYCKCIASHIMLVYISVTFYGALKITWFGFAIKTGRLKTYETNNC